MERGQIQWRGVTFGPGTDIELVEVTGLEDLPETDMGIQRRSQQDGAWPGEIFTAERVIEATMEIAGADTAEARRTLRRATAHSKRGETERLRFMLDDVEYFVNAQLTARALPTSSAYDRLAAPIVQWTCADPRAYFDEQVLTIPFAVPGAGPSYPFAYPTPYVVVAGEPGSALARNAGNSDTHSVTTLPGPCSIPWVEFRFEDGTVKRIEVEITLAEGESVVLDTLAGTALVGTASRYTSLVGAILQDFLLPAGATTVAWGALFGTPTAPATFRFASADQ